MRRQRIGVVGLVLCLLALVCVVGAIAGEPAKSPAGLTPAPDQPITISAEEFATIKQLDTEATLAAERKLRFQAEEERARQALYYTVQELARKYTVPEGWRFEPGQRAFVKP